jgi:hypothetical protein
MHGCLLPSIKLSMKLGLIRQTFGNIESARDPYRDCSSILGQRISRPTPTWLWQVEGEETPAVPTSKKIWGGPFKPSFGLSGVVADPNPQLRVIRVLLRDWGM